MLGGRHLKRGMLPVSASEERAVFKLSTAELHSHEQGFSFRTRETVTGDTCVLDNFELLTCVQACFVQPCGENREQI